MDQVTELTKAWIAGFFDGEGCVSIHMQAERRGRASDSLGLTIQLSNTSLVTLETIRTAYGGRIHRKKGYKNRQQCYSWQVCGALSDIFVRAILPYSKVKLPQLELYLHARTLFAKPHELQKPFSNEKRLARHDVARLAIAMKHPHVIAKGA